MAVQKRDVISALSRAPLPGAEKGAVALRIIIDVLVDQDGAVTVLVADRIGGASGAEVPEEWLRVLQTAAGSVPGVTAVRVQRRPVGTAPPSVQQATQHRRPVIDTGAARVIAIASGKGGVGKSTVTANLAAQLAAAGHRVAAVDADIYGFSLPSLLGVATPPGATPDKRLVPARSPSGVQLLSMDFFVKGTQAIVWRGPMLGRALQQFLADASWDDPEYLLLDLPPGTGDIALDVHELLPGSQEIVVTTPDPLAARVAVRAGEMAQRTGHSVLGVVENLSYLRCGRCGEAMRPFGQGGGTQVAESLGAPLLASMPFGDAMEPGTGLFPAGSETAALFAQLAERVAREAVAAGAGGV